MNILVPKAENTACAIDIYKILVIIFATPANSVI